MTLTNTVGVVIVDNVAYPNSWVQKGQALRYRPTCVLCADSGEITEDDGSKTPCDCTRGTDGAA